MVTYCADVCNNRDCDRHLLKIPKDTQVSVAYFKQELDCKEHIMPKTVNELVEQFEWFKGAENTD